MKQQFRQVFFIGFFLILFSASPSAQESVIELKAAPGEKGAAIKGSIEKPVQAESGKVVLNGTGVDLTGTWCGSWRSCKNGHNGKLSAQFCRLDSCHVRATFRGTFAKVIPFRYPATLKIISEQPGEMILSGSQRLGPIMGSFEYQVTITPNSFQATYRAKRDWGIWTLQRN